MRGGSGLVTGRPRGRLGLAGMCGQPLSNERDCRPHSLIKSNVSHGGVQAERRRATVRAVQVGITRRGKLRGVALRPLAVCECARLNHGHTHTLRGGTLLDDKKTRAGEGVVYVLTNPSMPDLAKIGTTSDIETRMRDLYKATGVPERFECVLAVRVENAAAIEKALHAAFEDKRRNPSREFFDIAPEQATAILEAIKLEDVTPAADGEGNVGSRPHARRGPFTFAAHDIPKGAEIRYTGGEAIAVVAGPRTEVSYEGRECLLTPLTKELKGTDKQITTTYYWKYRGRTLRDIQTDRPADG